jgi:hypothetical protein
VHLVGVLLIIVMADARNREPEIYLKNIPLAFKLSRAIFDPRTTS